MISLHCQEHCVKGPRSARRLQAKQQFSQSILVLENTQGDFLHPALFELAVFFVLAQRQAFLASRTKVQIANAKIERLSMFAFGNGSCQGMANARAQQGGSIKPRKILQFLVISPLGGERKILNFSLPRWACNLHSLLWDLNPRPPAY